ncbi:MAG TPA: glycosyltransferase [Verrucomicrobiae bacterium]|nr:glycosyltransferase [Verrucomicrobiae bacterium]
MPMARRLKVLISAYSCEPGKGSEPEVGWQWALQMARFHEVTVLTRANNRASIEPELARLQQEQPLPEFVYHDRGPTLLAFKRKFRATIPYYLMWQRSAHELVETLHAAHHYDLMHHVTFAAVRYPAVIWGHNVPCIWGPVGGIESVPAHLLPWSHGFSLAHELVRNAHNVLQATPFRILPQRGRASTLVLASTGEMQKVFARMGIEAELMPTIGLQTSTLPFRPHPPRTGPLRLLFVGNIITLKGVDLALDAFAKSQIQGTFTLVGAGNFLESAKALARRRGLEERILFRGRLPRERVLQLYSDYDLFIFPSLHDTGGYAVIEAMLNQLPVVCLDCGGPAVAVRDGCGIRVPVRSRNEIIQDLAAAMQRYDKDRQLLQEHGQAARQAVLDHYDWERKADEMNRCYQKAVENFPQSPSAKTSGYSGLRGLPDLLHRTLSVRGLLVACMTLVVIGALGFASLGQLKHQAQDIVVDTLPGLSYAGEINANLSQAFNRSMLMALSQDSQERARWRQELDGYTKQTTRWLEQYRTQIFDPTDQRLFENVLRCREQYLGIRNHFFELLTNNQTSEVSLVIKNDLLPAYEQYVHASDRLFRYNMEQGQQRGKGIMRLCSVTQVIVAIIGIMVFAAGFLSGLFK